jgi:hypothetical protein
MSNATPEQDAALDAIESKVNALSATDRALLEAYLQSHHEAPNTAAEAVALIPEIEKAIHTVTHAAISSIPVRDARQTVGASLPLQSLAR